MALPINLLCGMLVLLPKTLGGTRTIAVLPTIYRLLLAVLRDEWCTWDADMTMDGGPVDDTTARTRGAERGAMQRQLLAEAWATVGWTVVQLLWDVEAFYDSIDVAWMLTEAERWSMPLIPTGLATEQHLWAHGR